MHIVWRSPGWSSRSPATLGPSSAHPHPARPRARPPSIRTRSTWPAPAWCGRLRWKCQTSKAFGRRAWSQCLDGVYDVVSAASHFLRMDWGDGIFASCETWEEEFRVALESLEPSRFWFKKWFALRLPPATSRWFTPYLLFFCLGSASDDQNSVADTCFVGTGVAFAPKPSWVAFAPKWRGMKWVQGRMWPSFRGECDPCFCVAGAIVSEPQKDFFHPREWYSRVFLRSNSHFNQLPGHYACYGVPLLRCTIQFEQLPRRFGCYLPRDISINLWMLRCKIQFEQLGRHFGCYVPTAIWINFQHTMDATL